MISIDEIQAEQQIPIVETLHPDEAAAFCVPIALSRIRSTADQVLYIEAGLMVNKPLTAMVAKLESHPAVVMQTVVAHDEASSTPRLNQLEREPAYIFDRAVAFASNSEEIAGLVESWRSTVEETIVDPFLRPPTATLRSLIKGLASKPFAGVERETTLSDLEDFCLLSHPDGSEGPAMLVADALWDINRPVRRSFDPKKGRYEPIPDPAERRGNLLMQHRIHDPQPLERIEEAIRGAQTRCPIDLHTDTPYRWFCRDIRRSSDPLGLRWGIGEEAAFQGWLYESNDVGLTRVAHLYWYARGDLQEAFPDAVSDPSLYRAWSDDRAVTEFGVDFFEPLGDSEYPEVPAQPATEWLASRRRLRNALEWRWNTATSLMPGHVARRERKKEKLAAPSFEEPKRIDVAPSRRPFGSEPRRLTLMGLLRSNSGLGQAARSSFHALKILNRDFSHLDTTDQYLSRNTTDPGLQSVPLGAYGDVNLIHANAAEFASRLGLFHHRIAGRYNVAMWFWEGAQLPEPWLPGFDVLDELWVASEYLADVFGQYGRIPVRVVGLAAELPQRSESTRQDVGLSDDELVFLFVYDAQSVPTRKNPEKALEAFIAAFGPSFEGVRFVLKVHNLHKFPESERRLREMEIRYDAVTIIDDYLPRRTMLDLMQHADVYVSLHAAEGFGLTLLESMALGTPVISTAFSGNMDFTTTDNSWLVDYRMIALDEQVGPYPKGTVWADPNVESVVEIMRSIRHDPSRISAKADRAVADALEAASLEKYAAKLDTQLRRVL